MVAYTYAYPMQLQQLVTTPRQGSSPCILHASLHVLVVYITWSRAHRYGTARFPHYSFPSFSRSRFSLGRDDLSIKPVHCATPGFSLCPPPPSLALLSSPPLLRLQLLLAITGRTAIFVRAITHAAVAGPVVARRHERIGRFIFIADIARLIAINRIYVHPTCSMSRSHGAHPSRKTLRRRHKGENICGRRRHNYKRFLFLTAWYKRDESRRGNREHVRGRGYINGRCRCKAVKD